MPQPHLQSPSTYFNLFAPSNNQQTSSSSTQTTSCFQTHNLRNQSSPSSTYRPQSWMTGIPSRKLEPRPAGAEQRERRSSEASLLSTPHKEAEPSSAQRRSSVLETLYVSVPSTSSFLPFLDQTARIPTNTVTHRHRNPALKASISLKLIAATTLSSPTRSERRSVMPSPSKDRRWSPR